MKMTNKEYNAYVKTKAPKSKLLPNLLKAFLAGGLICCVGQGILLLYRGFGLGEQDAAAAVSISLVFLGALLTGIGVYDNMAKFGGAGTLVPITGFANSVVAPALEFKSEGLVLGMSAKMFVIAGPVIVFGVSASALYGMILAMVSER